MLYEMVKGKLIRQIIKPGKILPSERQLTEQFKVSRITIRRAIAELRREGLVYCIPGKGTFAREAGPRPTSRMLAVLSLFDVYQDHFAGEVFSAMQTEAHRLGFHLTFGKLDRDDHSRQMMERLAKTHGVDGYLVLGGVPDDLLAMLRRYQLPMVLIDHALRDNTVSAVLSDNLGGADEMTRYLISQGHRRIAHLTKPVPSISFSLRQAGWEKALKDSGITPSRSWVWDLTSIHDPSGEDLRQRLAQEKPTAIFCANDSLALHLMWLMKVLNLTAPADLSVAGFDDMYLAKFVGLTTMRVPAREMGQTAIRHLAGLVQGEKLELKRIELPVQLVARATTAPLAAAPDLPPKNK